MANRHGNNAGFQLDSKAGSLTDLQSITREFSVEVTHESGQCTAMGTAKRTKQAGIKDWSVSWGGLWDSTLDEVLDASIAKSRSFQGDPGGSESGQVRYTGEVIGASFEIDIDFEGEVTASWSGEGNGTLTRSTI